MVLAYDKEPKDPLLLGRAFPSTADARIDVKKGRISLDICDVVMEFDMDGSKSLSLICSNAPYKDTSTQAATISPPETPPKATIAQLADKSCREPVSTDTTLVSTDTTLVSTDTTQCQLQQVLELSPHPHLLQCYVKGTPLLLILFFD